MFFWPNIRCCKYRHNHQQFYSHNHPKDLLTYRLFLFESGYQMLFYLNVLGRWQFSEITVKIDLEIFLLFLIPRNYRGKVFAQFFFIGNRICNYGNNLVAFGHLRRTDNKTMIPQGFNKAPERKMLPLVCCAAHCDYLDDTPRLVAMVCESL